MASGAEAPGTHRILVQSDQHLERSDWRFPDRLPPHDVAVFAGDLGSPLVESLRILAEARASGIGLSGEIVFVPGNHEFYGADMAAALAEGRALAAALGIRLLDGDEAVIDGVRYLGTTLWTDYALHGEPGAAMSLARDADGMNDHVRIDIGREAFTPAHALRLHRRRRAWLEGRLAVAHGGPTVVVTHHLPSARSINGRFEGDPINPCFASDLDALVLAHAPALWIHGHTHDSCDYVLGTTRVVCNPKGYGPSGELGIENVWGFVEDLVVELPPGRRG
jgi:hypothetical protein